MQPSPRFHCKGLTVGLKSLVDVYKRQVWLSSSGITNSYNHTQAEDALRSAAYTYVVAALGSLATLIYYIMIAMGRRD